MVLKETSKEYPNELIPSFEKSNANIITEDTNRSTHITKVLIEYEKQVVPKMLELGFMKEIAKSRSKPYYNDSDQTMTAHILPGIEIMADIIEKSDSIDESKFKQLISLWTIHDLHKIVNNSREKEFEIDIDVVESWVNKLELDKFTGRSLNIDDFYACVVGLHNGKTAKLNESTNKFMHLRPHLRLVDAIMSISHPDKFVNQAEKPVGAVFGGPNEIYLPAAHSITMEDSIIRTILNKSIKEELSYIGLKPIDLRDNGVLYARSENISYGNIDDLLSRIVDNFIENIKNSYSIFRNPAFLGGDINSGDSHLGDWYMPTVYDITNLSKLCLTNTEIIQRIVQAAVEQQNRSWDISDTSSEKIDRINNTLDIKIPKSSFIEGMATLVHTVYRNILPELICENSNNSYERTLESAIIHVFGVSENVQKEIAQSLEENNLNSSVTGWPYKYLVANDLFERYTRKLSDKERQKVLTEMISSRLSDFSKWDQYTKYNEQKIKRELSIMFATNIKLDDKLLSEYDSLDIMNDYLAKRGEHEIGYLSNKPTEQNAKSPDLLSHRNIDILNVPFVTENENEEFELLELDNVMPKHPLSVLTQISLNIRAQQFKDYKSVKNTTSLYITIHPVDSISVASYVRFNEILQYLKQEIFTGQNSSIGLKNVADNYKDIIKDSVSQSSGVNSLVDREQAFNIGAHMDEASSCLTLPDDSETTIAKGAICATIASIMSGVRVCITKNPQLYMNHPNKDELVIYGPELSMFENLINNSTDIKTLPQQLEIIERLMILDDKTNKSNVTIQQYNNLYKNSSEYIIYTPGSQVFCQIVSLFDTEKDYISSIKNAVNIDAIAAQEDEYSKEILQYNKNIGRALSKVLPNNYYKPANIVMTRIYDVLYTMESINNTDELINDILQCLTEIDMLDIDNTQKGSSAWNLANEIAQTYECIGEEKFHEVRKPIINGTVVRAIMCNSKRGY